MPDRRGRATTIPRGVPRRRIPGEPGFGQTREAGDALASGHPPCSEGPSSRRSPGALRSADMLCTPERGGGLNPAEIESGVRSRQSPVADSSRVARPGIAIPGPGGAGTIGTACPFNASRTTACRVMVERLQPAMPCGRSRDMDWPCDHAARACRYQTARTVRVTARWLRSRQGERIRRLESRRAASYRVVRSRGRTVNASSRRVLTVVP